MISTWRLRVALIMGISAFGLAATSTASAGTGLNAYEVDVADGADLQTLREEGFDIVEGGSGDRLEIIATRSQVAALRKQGVDPEIKVVDGMTAREFATRSIPADGSYDVYRPYFDDTYDGTVVERRPRTEPTATTLYQEMLALAEENPAIVQAVEIGRTINDVPILALRVTRDAREASNPTARSPPSSTTPPSTPASGSPRR